MAGLLTCPSFKLPSHPLIDEQWHLGAKTITRLRRIGHYSSGNCSGFLPDSLLKDRTKVKPLPF
jgi:hypothetical protein